MKRFPLVPTEIRFGNHPFRPATREDYTELANRYGDVNVAALIHKIESMGHRLVALGFMDGDQIEIRVVKSEPERKGFFRNAMGLTVRDHQFKT